MDYELRVCVEREARGGRWAKAGTGSVYVYIEKPSQEDKSHLPGKGRERHNKQQQQPNEKETTCEKEFVFFAFVVRGWLDAFGTGSSPGRSAIIMLSPLSCLGKRTGTRPL